MRYELKYVLNSNQVYKINKWLYSIKNLKKIYEPRRVNSIYYDDAEFTCAQNNIDGISERKKYRLRWYNNNINKNFYEIKLKKNKLSKKIIYESKKEINFQNIKKLFSHENINFEDNDFKNYLTDKNLEPKLKVSYDRVYYITGKVRITIDKNLIFSLFDNSSFSRNFKDERIILEIKFHENNFIDGLQLINNCFTSPIRFSKYVRGLSLCGLANYY